VLPRLNVAAQPTPKAIGCSGLLGRIGVRVTPRDGRIKRFSNCAHLLAARLQKENPCKEQHKDEIIYAVDAEERTSKKVLRIELYKAVF